MKTIAVLLTAFCALIAASASAATRGGTFIFGASADCIFLDPVYEQQNPDIWFAMNVYDTLLSHPPTARRCSPVWHPRTSSPPTPRR